MGQLLYGLGVYLLTVVQAQQAGREIPTLKTVLLVTEARHRPPADAAAPGESACPSAPHRSAGPQHPPRGFLILTLAAAVAAALVWRVCVGVFLGAGRQHSHECGARSPSRPHASAQSLALPPTAPPAQPPGLARAQC